MSDHDWRALGSVMSRQLGPARVELHWAAQVVAASAAALLAPEDDDSHTAMLWQPERESLASQDMGGRTLYLRLRDATLQLVSEDIFVEGEFALGGRTLDEAMAWARGALSIPTPLARPSHDMPAHAVGDGGLFSLGLDAAMIELASWYDNAHAALSEYAEKLSASSVRCWPHHFDIATLLVVEPNLDSEQAKSIGVGMTPGDSSYQEPYFYVTPWPYPNDATALPELPEGGVWHTTGWVGAVLTGTALTSARDADAQSQHVRAFLSGAGKACRSLL